MKPILLLLAMLLLVSGVSADDVAAAAPVVTDQSIVDYIAGMVPANWIAAIWVIATAVGTLASVAAWAIRRWWPESPAAHWVDLVAHWSSLIGTSVKPAQVKAAPRP